MPSALAKKFAPTGSPPAFPAPQQAPAELSPEWLALKLRNAAAIDAEVAQLQEEEHADEEELERLRERRQRRESRRRAHVAIRIEANRARSFLCSQAPCAELETIKQRIVNLMKKEAELRVRYGINASKMLAPDEHPDCKRAAELDALIVSLESQVRANTKAEMGTTPAERALPRYLSERANLADGVDKYRQKYAHWHEIASVRAQINQLAADRDRLQQEHDATVIAKALKPGK